jgi:hypothetical protein
MKQLWPVIKTRVKDPTLLMNTVNQCVGNANKEKGQAQLAEEKLINDIELLGPNDKQISSSSG